eukprot:2919127-Rhodomonas_salina.1
MSGTEAASTAETAPIILRPVTGCPVLTCGMVRRICYGMFCTAPAICFGTLTTDLRDWGKPPLGSADPDADQT